MRLDHLLSMETMRCFHEHVVVGIDGSVRNLYGAFVVQFSEIKNLRKKALYYKGV